MLDGVFIMLAEYVAHDGDGKTREERRPDTSQKPSVTCLPRKKLQSGEKALLLVDCRSPSTGRYQQFELPCGRWNGMDILQRLCSSAEHRHAVW